VVVVCDTLATLLLLLLTVVVTATHFFCLLQLTSSSSLDENSEDDSDDDDDEEDCFERLERTANLLRGTATVLLGFLTIFFPPEATALLLPTEVEDAFNFLRFVVDALVAVVVVRDGSLLTAVAGFFIAVDVNFVFVSVSEDDDDDDDDAGGGL